LKRRRFSVRLTGRNYKITAWFVTTLLLAACAGSPVITPTSALPQAPIVTTRQATPTARVLGRADQSGDAAAQVLPGDHDENDHGTALPSHADAIKALPKVGQAAPDFTLKTLDGSTIALHDLRGKAVLLNFWTSWCVACRDESPLLESFYQAHRTDGLVILSVNITSEDTLDAARAYVKEMQLTFPIPLDEDGSVSKRYQVPGLPVSVFIDTQGIIRNIIVGQMHSGDLTEGLPLMGVQ
jgi:peroxiredoxin